MEIVIERVEDGNWREREDRRTGQIRVAKSIVVKWLAIQDDSIVEEFEQLKDARAKYPLAKLVKTNKNTTARPGR